MLKDLWDPGRLARLRIFRLDLGTSVGLTSVRLQPSTLVSSSCVERSEVCPPRQVCIGDEVKVSNDNRSLTLLTDYRLPSFLRFTGFPDFPGFTFFQNRSRLITLSHAATKSRTNFFFASAQAYTSATARNSEFEPKTRSARVAVHFCFPVVRSEPWKSS